MTDVFSPYGLIDFFGPEPSLLPQVQPRLLSSLNNVTVFSLARNRPFRMLSRASLARCGWDAILLLSNFPILGYFLSFYISLGGTD